MSKRVPRRKPIWLEKEAHKPTKADLPDVMELFDAKESTRIALLKEIQIEEGLEGLRYNNVVFSASLRDGKRSTDLKVLREELVGKYGMRIEDVNAALDFATKQGESYWVKEVKVL